MVTLLLLSLPLWKKLSNGDSSMESDAHTRVMSMREIVSTPGVNPETGAGLIVFYFLGIAKFRI